MRRLLVVVMLLACLTAACGYHTPGQGDRWIGGEGQTLFVDLMANRTAEPYLDNYLTASVIRQLARSRLFELTEDRQHADLLLTGIVADFDSAATAYGRDDHITDYRVSIRVSVRLTARGSGEVLWEDELRRRVNFYAATDKNQQLEDQSLAARQIAERLAEDIHARLLGAF